MIIRALLLVVILGFLAIWATSAWSASRANDAQECMLLTDYGLTTRAMVISGISLEKRLEILAQMYLLDERMSELAKIVRKAADKSDQRVGDFAGTVYRTCVGNEGELDSLLGPAS